MSTPTQDFVTSAQGWNTTTLNYAVNELMREFPQIDARGIVTAVTMTSQTVDPREGRVALLSKARDLLKPVVESRARKSV